MTIHPISIDLKLPDDGKIDIFLVQWHTPLPVRGNHPIKIDVHVAGTKRVVLERLRDFLLNGMIPQSQMRPAFIIMPELSLPFNQIAILEGLLNRLNRQMVIVAGVEYMTWDEYVTEVRALPDMPNPDSWLVGGANNQFVNAAVILLREEGGRVRKYLQPKLHPEDHEQALPIFFGRSVFVFQSAERQSGVRVNFCVQVCSDFTHPAFVTELRARIETAIPGLQLDFTLLLQMQKNQDVIQFKQAVQSYFEPPIRKVSTDQGCLLFVNNANDRQGKTDLWGKTKINFPFGCWREEVGCTHTYWIKDDGGHNHQAVTMRESGPGIYWLVYKPHYLVNHTPGSGQSLPFSEPAPKFATIEDLVVTGRLDMNSFVPIPPTRHWLEWEWKEGLAEYKAELETAGKDDVLVNDCVSGFEECIEGWLLAISDRDEKARNAVNTYFCCWDAKKSSPLTEKEPLFWHGDCSTAAKQFMRVYTLIWISRSVFPGGSLVPSTGTVVHSVGGTNLGITLCWGGVLPLRQTVVRLLKYLNSRPLSNFGLSKHLVITMVFDHPDMNEFRRQLPNLTEQITKSHEAPLGYHLQEGDLVQGADTLRLRVLHGGDLLGAEVAANTNDLIARVSQRITEALAP